MTKERKFDGVEFEAWKDGKEIGVHQGIEIGKKEGWNLALQKTKEEVDNLTVELKNSQKSDKEKDREWVKKQMAILCLNKLSKIIGGLEK